ncbi:MAG TPA: AI-2E family transporter [Chloroflexota bacterium]|nr:AI-2E family transporter [Chloroflexota bacterium]
MIARWWIPPLVLVVVLYLAREVLAPFVIAAVLAYVFSPIVSEISERLKLPRIVVVAAVYVILLTVVGLGAWLLGARLIREVRLLGRAGPDLVDAAYVRLLGTETFRLAGQRIDAHVLADWTNSRISDVVAAPADALRVAERALDTVLKMFLSLIALFYLLLDGHRLGPYLLRFVAESRRARVQEVGRHVHNTLSQYIRGQLFLIVLMSVVTYLVLSSLFRLPFALPIAILTGVLEVIPLLGPITAGATAAMVALVQGGTQLMIWVIVAYIVLRQAEDQLIMPIVVGRAVDLHPLVTIFAVLTGAATAGALGAILAVPIAAAIRIILDDIVAESQAADAEPAEEPDTRQLPLPTPERLPPAAD